MEITPGLRRIGNDIIAAYLVLDDTGVTLVDAALSGFLPDLRRELAAAGRSLADLRGVILTHGDMDHVGIAERLRSELGVPVYVGAADAARARGEESSHPAAGPRRLGPVLRFFGYALRKGGARTRWLREVRTVADGEVLALPGAPRILALPGHSPGSVAVHLPSVRAVAVGDALTTRHVLTGVTGPAPAPFTDDPALADASLERLADLDVDLVLPGHGAPFHGTTEQLLTAYRVARRAQGTAGD
ncbi:MAG: MBL fold metallo-hydrolase [Actinomycetales bacterium]|nr:MBL fold metallo-hydrolase [Actinomycetales bacterium]